MKLNEFNGNRLRSARNYRGFTVENLASVSGINKKDIQSFEEGKYFPTLENSMKISGSLQFPREYFYTADKQTVSIERKHFNTQSKLPRNTEISYREKLVMLNRVYDVIKKYIKFPDANIDFSELENTSDIEETALKTRKMLKIGNNPAQDMTGIMERAGFILTDMNVDKKQASPITQKQKTESGCKYFIAVGNDRKSAVYRNTDLANELGFIVSNELGISSKNFDTEEFAAAFLLPEDEFRKDLGDTSEIEGYLEVSSKWIVPVHTSIYRAYSIGAINYRKYCYLMDSLEKKGWLQKDPLGNIKAIAPKMVKGAVELLIEEKIFTADTFMDVLEKEGIYVYSNEIEEITGVKKGYLSGKNKSNVEDFESILNRKMAKEKNSASKSKDKRNTRGGNNNKSGKNKSGAAKGKQKGRKKR